MLDVGCWMHVVTSDFGQMGNAFSARSFITSQQQRTKQQAFIAIGLLEKSTQQEI